MSIGSRIRALRIANGYKSQQELADVLYVNQTAVSQWERGATTPNNQTLLRLCELFHCSSDYILGQSDAPGPVVPPGFIPLPETEEVPVVGAIACGEPITAEENIEGRTSVPKEWHANFALVCKGHSMEPKINDGDVVAIRSQPTVDNGQIAAVRIDNEATLKKVYLFEGRLELRPINPDYESIVLFGEDMETVTIEGLAVGLSRAIT